MSVDDDASCGWVGGGGVGGWGGGRWVGGGGVGGWVVGVLGRWVDGGGRWVGGGVPPPPHPPTPEIYKGTNSGRVH